MVRDQITVELWEELNRLYLFVRSRGGAESLAAKPERFLPANQGRLPPPDGHRLRHAHPQRGLVVLAGGQVPRTGGQDLAHPGRAPPVPARTGHARARSARPRRWSGRPSSAPAAPGTPTSPFTARKFIPRLVAEFLLFNEDFPRSVRFCVGELNAALRSISGVPERPLLQRRREAGRAPAGRAAIQHGGRDLRAGPARLPGPVPGQAQRHRRRALRRLHLPGLQPTSGAG